MACDQKFKFAVTGKKFSFQSPAHCDRDYSKHVRELFIRSVSIKVFGSWLDIGHVAFSGLTSALFPNKINT